MRTRLAQLARICFWIFCCLLLVFLARLALRPITDPDFWWHLKTGKTMVELGGLLHSDPFTFTSTAGPTIREQLILKGYWLWELIAYALYAGLGFNGIFLLNALVLAIMVAVVGWQMKRTQVDLAIAVPLAVMGAYLFWLVYLMERPQILSFLFAALLLAMLYRVKDGGKLDWKLPLVMMLWSNFHGGFVVGDLILVCFAAGTVIEHRRQLSAARHTLIWLGLGFAASLLNPNGGLAFIEVFKFTNSSLMKNVQEYRNTWVSFQEGSHLFAILWVLVGLYFLGTWLSKRYYWPEILVALFLAYFSVMYTRNVAFFAIGMLAPTGEYLTAGLRRFRWRIPALVAIIVILVASNYLYRVTENLQLERQQWGAAKQIYPDAAVSFILDNDMAGHMYNSYEYGGYLLWRLAPKIKVFIDGRGIDTRTFADWKNIYYSVSKRAPDGKPTYQELLDNYAIDYVILPIYMGDGSVQPLMKRLLNEPEWVPVYLDTYVFILARAEASNHDLIARKGIDKQAFTRKLLFIYQMLSSRSPNQVGYQVAKADMMTYLGMYEQARVLIQNIQARYPGEHTLPKLKKALQILSRNNLERSH